MHPMQPMHPLRCLAYFVAGLCLSGKDSRHSMTHTGNTRSVHSKQPIRAGRDMNRMWRHLHYKVDSILTFDSQWHATLIQIDRMRDTSRANQCKRVKRGRVHGDCKRTSGSQRRGGR
jgi:hypothetical protein